MRNPVSYFVPAMTSR